MSNWIFESQRMLQPLMQQTIASETASIHRGAENIGRAANSFAQIQLKKLAFEDNVKRTAMLQQVENAKLDLQRKQLETLAIKNQMDAELKSQNQQQERERSLYYRPTMDPKTNRMQVAMPRRGGGLEYVDVGDVNDPNAMRRADRFRQMGMSPDRWQGSAGYVQDREDRQAAARELETQKIQGRSDLQTQRDEAAGERQGNMIELLQRRQDFVEKNGDRIFDLRDRDFHRRAIMDIQHIKEFDQMMELNQEKLKQRGEEAKWREANARFTILRMDNLVDSMERARSMHPFDVQANGLNLYSGIYDKYGLKGKSPDRIRMFLEGDPARGIKPDTRASKLKEELAGIDLLIQQALKVAQQGMKNGNQAPK